ncbi:MAG TPA: aminotransferase class III-fold pyridoxal phosphate-dependent enzyme, partial [Pyrinomonadaceae bacterium]|nr:aminotransferase class III-fold pyridoxal phosphate-dependent enzyme [Pyrinomonadaceae bacterium]
DEVAAIVVECVQGEGGYVPAPKEFLQGLRSICDEHGILLVVDEVQSGMGRTGKMFASDHYDLKPDIVTVAKGIGSGLPIGACVARADVMNWKSGAHASTFGGNPVCIAAALKTIELLEGGLINNAAEVGAYLKAGLEKLKAKHECIGDVAVVTHDRRIERERLIEIGERAVQVAFGVAHVAAFDVDVGRVWFDKERAVVSGERAFEVAFEITIRTALELIGGGALRLLCVRRDLDGECEQEERQQACALHLEDLRQLDGPQRVGKTGKK